MTDEISKFADHTKFFQRSGMLEHQKFQVYSYSMVIYLGKIYFTI